MKTIKNKILPLLLVVAIVFSVTSCAQAGNNSSSPDDTIVNSQSPTSSEEQVFNTNDAINENAVTENIKNKVFPMFSNKVDYSRGGSTTNEEEFLDYKEYAKSRHTYTDMVGHDSEVSAVRLAELGIFSKTETFSPNSSMTVAGFLKALMMVCRQDINGSTSNDDLKKFIESTNFLEEGIEIDYSAVLTNEQLAYFLSRATEAVDNYQQYELLLDDYKQIKEEYRKGVLQSIALGITEINNFRFNPTVAAKRSDIADGLYRLVNTGARVIPLYNLGNLYSKGESVYLTKTSYKQNDAGLQFGFFANYNKQASVFETFGKLPIDRTGFNKWSQIEKEQGVYSWPTFTNDSSPHKLGNTSIICIDISSTNHQYKNIPSFYPQTITDETTRSAAKRFLYQFVQKMMGELEGDVLLLIDYELDFQQAIYNNDVGYNRAKIFSQWFIEACEVAREAARNAGKGDNLKLAMNYNNITDVHKRGVKENQWMIDMAKVVDYVTVDSYNKNDDWTDASITIENIRFLMNNYSLGKPVLVVENGLSISKNTAVIDKVTGLNQMQMSTKYFENLFREFKFALERGDFLNANLQGFLVWSYFDTQGSQTNFTAVAADDNTLYDNGKAIKKGVDLLYKQNQFNPSYIDSISEASITAPEITIKSGTEYEKLTYVITDYNTATADGKLRVKLSEQGTAFITINGKTHMAHDSLIDSHVFELSGMRDGLNVIDIYFGHTKAPSTRTVEKIVLS